MVFNPTFQGGVSFEQPVQQPSVLGAVGSVVQGLFSGREKTDTPKPTEGDKFQASVAEFQNNEGAAFKWDRSSVRKFAFQYPQYADRISTFAETVGVRETPAEGLEEAQVTWFQTPEGIAAVGKAMSLPEDEREGYIANAFAATKQQEAELAKLNRERDIYAAQGTLEGEQWRVLQPARKDFTDNLVSTILNPIITDVSNGLTLDIDPVTQAQLGLRYKQVSMSNLSAVLADSRNFILKQHRADYAAKFGADAIPPKEWEENVMASVDALIKVGEAFDTPQERLAAQKALIGSNVLGTFDKAGLAGAVYIAENFPEALADRMIGSRLDLLTSVMFDAGTGQLFGTKGITRALEGASKKEAEDIAKMTVTMLQQTATPEVFTAFREAAKRSGYNVIDGATFQTIVGSNVTELNRLAKTNPTFRTEFTDFLFSDLSQTRTAIESQLTNRARLVFENGKFSIVASNPRGYAGDFAGDLAAGLDEGMNLDTLNQKFATLKLLGDVGTEVQEALGMVNAPTGGAAQGGGGGGGVTQDIGSALGIDFARYESEAGLPAGYLNKVAMIESGGNPEAQNAASSAGGLFQQIDSNAKAYGVTNRFDPVQSTEGAVRFAVENKAYLTRVLGREPTGGELYLAHQQGPGGAAKLLSNSTARAVDVVGAEAVRLNGGNENMTAGEFANIWISKYNGSRGQTTASTASTPSSLPQESSEPRAIAPTISGEGRGVASVSAGVSTPTEGAQTPLESPSTQSTGQSNAGRGMSLDSEVQAFLDSLSDDESAMVFKSEAALQKAKASGKVQVGDKVIVGNKVVEVS